MFSNSALCHLSWRSWVVLSVLLKGDLITISFVKTIIGTLLMDISSACGFGLRGCCHFCVCQFSPCTHVMFGNKWFMCKLCNSSHDPIKVVSSSNNEFNVTVPCVEATSTSFYCPIPLVVSIWALILAQHPWILAHLPHVLLVPPTI